MSARTWNVLVTGGAGYVGSALIPKLLEAGHRVTVLDLYLYGDVHAPLRPNPKLIEVKGDLRDPEAVAQALEGCDAVIHLACISNDPSFNLDPALGRSINFDSFRPLVRAAKKAGVTRFVYASSSSVYGIKEEENVSEDLPLEPLTDYSRFKMMCEQVLEEERESGFTTLTIRPATVCGYAPRLRLDLSVNILTNHAINTGKITVFGGSQKRPNIHIGDMVDLYLQTLQWDDAAIDGKIFNVGYENHTIMEIAEMVRDVVGRNVAIEVTQTDDLRSYHISSARIASELGFRPKRTIADAARDLKAAFDAGLVPNSMTDPRWFNIKLMQRVGLS
ncbi:NAD-dependent epimerase/dehydratase family protein [Azospirillum sp.]|uniref:NAD-dependent epimerase/dehydratase family protein n=1 Tax=Azospirillum sp. TaxID=34012 RepID=UPI002622290F|nr:NAD-dependent epimerase/dehydratase family protein [Azospirillum sp.]